MPIQTFLEYVRGNEPTKSNLIGDQSVSKTLKFAEDDFEIVININLSKAEQHKDAIKFLHQVTAELYALLRATTPKVARTRGIPREHNYSS